MQVLFVCTGNICRSPTAERLAAAYSRELGLKDFTAVSAGLRAVIGHGIHPYAALVLESLGGDAAGFAARQLTPKAAETSDLILTMTKAHRSAVLERVPKLLNRSFTLHEAASLVEKAGARSIAELADLRGYIPAHELVDIRDPIGRDPDFFEHVGVQIADLVPSVLKLSQRSSSDA